MDPLTTRVSIRPARVEDAPVLAQAERAITATPGRLVSQSDDGTILGVTPTVLRTGPYRFFFFSSDKHEPPHIHVERDTKRAKLWLEPVGLDKNEDFAARELGAIAAIVEDHREELLRAWHDFFSD